MDKVRLASVLTHKTEEKMNLFCVLSYITRPVFHWEAQLLFPTSILTRGMGFEAHIKKTCHHLRGQQSCCRSICRPVWQTKWKLKFNSQGLVFHSCKTGEKVASLQIGKTYFWEWVKAEISNAILTKCNDMVDAVSLPCILVQSYPCRYQCSGLRLNLLFVTASV